MLVWKTSLSYWDSGNFSGAFAAVKLWQGIKPLLNRGGVMFFVMFITPSSKGIIHILDVLAGLMLAKVPQKYGLPDGGFQNGHEFKVESVQKITEKKQVQGCKCGGFKPTHLKKTASQ